jgi:pantothenate kinase
MSEQPDIVVPEGVWYQDEQGEWVKSDGFAVTSHYMAVDAED